MQFKFNLLFIILLLAALLSSAQQKGSNFLLATNSTGLSGSITQKEIGKIFQGKYSRWPKTQKQVIVLLPSSKHPNATIIAKLMGFSTFKELQKFWLSMVFQGRFNAPLFLDTDEEIIDYVNRNTGSVGIVSADLINMLKKESYSQIVE